MNLETDEHEKKMQESLDRFSVTWIKIVGIVGILMGLIIIGVFWYWLLSKLF